MYLKNVQSLGDSIQKAADDAKRYKDNLDLYFSRDFRSEYVQFARAMLNEVIEKIKPWPSTKPTVSWASPQELAKKN